MSTVIHPYIDALLQEPKPRKFDYPESQLPDNPAPIDRSRVGYVLAVKHVADADYQQLLADWRERQDTLLGFRSELDKESTAAMSSAASTVDSRASDEELARAMFGTARWAEILDEIERMQVWGAQRSDESARKASQFTKGIGRVEAIRERMQKELSEVFARAQKLHDELGPEADPAAKQRVLERAEQQAKALSDKAVQQINTQTRYILNLDDNTATVSTSDWLTRRGLID